MLMMVMTAMVVMMVMAVMLEMMVIAVTMQCFLDVAGYDSLLVAEVPPIPPQPRSSRSRLINYRGQNGAMDSSSCKLPSKFGFPR